MNNLGHVYKVISASGAVSNKTWLTPGPAKRYIRKWVMENAQVVKCELRPIERHRADMIVENKSSNWGNYRKVVSIRYIPVNSDPVSTTPHQTPVIETFDIK